MEIVTILGARPQFIKAAAVSRSFKNQSAINEIILHTGQHFDDNMSKIFFDEMQIPQPAYHLNINNLSHADMTGQMLTGIEKILKKENPDWVLVYGDTNSTLAGALAASKLHIKIAHVEAGLRSFNMKMPEEINRILTDRISKILFAPTNTAVKNLENEGFKNFPCSIVQCGDVMHDVALYYADAAEKKSDIIKQLPFREFVLCTLHREENTNDINILKNIIEALEGINEQIPVLLPLHPRTKNILRINNIKTSLHIIDPVGYFDMIELIRHCKLVMTDSGGLQKEAFFFQKHCITIRGQTEWVELVEHGYNIITGSDKNKILSAFKFLINKKSDFNMNLYGQGKASEIITQTLMNY